MFCCPKGKLRLINIFKFINQLNIYNSFEGYTSRVTYSFKRYDSRRMDIFSQADDNVGKLNDFFIFLKKQTGSSGFKVFEGTKVFTNSYDESSPISMALETWEKGHILKSYAILLEFYKNENYEKQQKILTTIQYLIFYTLATKGRAICGDVIEGARRFSEDTNEICVMVIVWFSLFISDWHDDKCAAEDILKSNIKLQSSLENIVPLVGFYLLKNNEIVSYQQLIETCLKFKFEKSTGLLLRALFNYYDEIGYHKGCEVIYDCCNQLGIKLTADQTVKYNRMKKLDHKTRIKDYIQVTRDMKYKF